MQRASRRDLRSHINALRSKSLKIPKDRELSCSTTRAVQFNSSFFFRLYTYVLFFFAFVFLRRSHPVLLFIFSRFNTGMLALCLFLCFSSSVWGPENSWFFGGKDVGRFSLNLRLFVFKDDFAKIHPRISRTQIAMRTDVERRGLVGSAGEENVKKQDKIVLRCTGLLLCHQRLCDTCNISCHSAPDQSQPFFILCLCGNLQSEILLLDDLYMLCIRRKEKKQNGWIYTRPWVFFTARSSYFSAGKLLR